MGLLWMVLGAPASGQQRGAITGRVVLDATGDPLHHAVVLVIPLGRSVQTNDQGEYRLENIPPGKYELVAHLHSLADERRTVEIAPGSSVTADFRLRLAPVREQLTVTASGREETTLETYLSTTSIDTVELTQQTATSLGEVLENQAGVAKRSFGPGTSRPVIRGFDGDRVLIMQDGVRTGTLSSQSGDHGEPLDPNSIERVEVVRGPSTLLYEGSAIGGVVNMVSGHHQIHKEPHTGLRGFLTSLGGTNNNRRGGSGGFEYGVKRWLFFGNGGAIYLDDYKTPAGTVPNSFSNIKDASSGFGRYGEKVYFNFSYSLQDGRYGIPFEQEHDEKHEEKAGQQKAAGKEEDHHHENVFLPFRRHNVRLNGGFKNLATAIEQFQLILNYSDWKHREQEADKVANRFYNKQFIYRGVFDQQPRGALSGTFGFWGLTRDYKAQGEEAITPPVDQNAIAVFAVEQLRMSRFRIQFGARLEHNRYDPEQGRKRSFTGIAASTGVHIPLWEGGALAGSFASSFRAPALEELYSFGPHAGNLTFEIGNPNLRRERGNGVDLSLRQRAGRWRGEWNFFYYRMSNFVFLAPTGKFEDGFPVADYRQGGARYRGSEARLSAGLQPNLWLHLGMDAVNAELRNPNLPLPRIPPIRGRLGLEGRWRSLSVMPELLLANKQARVYTLEDPTAGYAVMNLKALYSKTSKHFLHLFGFHLFNASDRLYRNHLSFIKAFAPEIGRGVLFSYTMRFF
ncbi:MAG: TonB-dependent receptor [Bryobacteraceae bacterium]|nr:TonB-dependent receptor [Bryobacteraceae bacterium]MDW8379671.1 TonB-dependent receptor [Bryobacterales bacterium]